nr:acyl-CoA dehydrogenase family protein [Streptomyces sp. CB02923]
MTEQTTGAMKTGPTTGAMKTEPTTESMKAGPATEAEPTTETGPTTETTETGSLDADGLRRRTAGLLAAHPPADTAPLDFLRARFDAGLAWVHFPRGLGGLDAPRALQAVVEAELEAAGAPDNDPRRIGIGLGMAAPTILRFGTDEQKKRFLRPLWTGEEVWCQLFSEPGAGSDLAALATRAVRDEEGTGWVVDGQKVWTSGAHQARWAILIARTDPRLPKHRGITYFVCDMTDPGVEVRPLRQITGEAEFNEVFLTGVRIPDAHRLGEVGEGWKVAQTTLMNERVAIGGARLPREGGMIGVAAQAWRRRPEARTHDLHQRLLRLWVDAEVARLTGERLRQQLAKGEPGPEGSGMKLAFARLAQQISGWEVEFLAEDGLGYDDWTLRRPEGVDFTGRQAGYRYLRAKGNSIEGGTSEVLLNIVAERVLGLPPEPRTDKDVAWKDLPR